MKREAALSHSMFFKTSFAVFVILTCALFYEHSLKIYSEEYEALNIRLTRLRDEYDKAVAINTDLKRHVNSQSDPAWIEMTLIKGLGLMPEGHQKVLFVKHSE